MSIQTPNHFDFSMKEVMNEFRFGEPKGKNGRNGARSKGMELFGSFEDVLETKSFTT